MRLRRASMLASAVLSLGLAFAVHGRADSASTDRLFADGAAALDNGAYDRAIDLFERFADLGGAHPDASFDRGLAYARRAGTPQRRPGDLGRAAAAFAETLELRRSDADAERALERVRAEIARRIVREGGDPIVVSPSLTRAVVTLVPEDVWAVAALVGSLAVSVAVVLRSAFSRHSVRLAGMVAGWVGALMLVTCGALALAAGHYRRSSKPAVVVVREARLLDERGVPLEHKGSGSDPVTAPEGAALWVLERREHLARVELGGTRAWVDTANIRVLARP